jgi:hypothetical protein
MWVFLSSRIRTWVLLAVALPLVRMLVHKVAAAAQDRHPDARTTRVLGRTDSAVAAVAGRMERRRK